MEQQSQNSTSIIWYDSVKHSRAFRINIYLLYISLTLHDTVCADQRIYLYLFMSPVFCNCLNSEKENYHSIVHVSNLRPEDQIRPQSILVRNKMVNLPSFICAIITNVSKLVSQIFDFIANNHQSNRKTLEGLINVKRWSI